MSAVVENTIPVVAAAKLSEFVESMKSLVVRHVFSVKCDPKFVKLHEVHYSPSEMVVCAPGQLPEDVEAKSEGWKKNHIENFASYFTGKTRMNNNETIFFSSECLFEFNPITFSFTQRMAGPKLVPYAGAVIVGTELGKDKYGNTVFGKWAQCSEQFYRLHKVVTEGVDNPSTKSLCKEMKTGAIESVYRALNRGSQLAVNSLAKVQLARKQLGLGELSHDEVVSKYVKHHSEVLALENTHWYNFVAATCVFNEGMCAHNIPQNLRRDDEQLSGWLVREDDAKEFYARLGVYVTGSKPVPLPEDYVAPEPEPVKEERWFEAAVKMQMETGMNETEARAAAIKFFGNPNKRWSDDDSDEE
jgi:hypothetical protein